MRKILLGIAIVLTAVFAQETNATYVMLGLGQPQIDSLNARLQSFNYSAFEKQLISYGFGFYSTVGGKFLMGFEWSCAKSKEITSKDGSVKEKLENSAWFINIGGMAINTGVLRIFPYLGLGQGKLVLTLKEVSLPSFDDIISGPAGVTKLETGGFLLNPALGVEFKIGGRYILGIHGGFVFDPSTGDWKVEGSAISGGPDDGLTGPWANLVFGLGT